MKKLLTILIISLGISCTKEETKVECYKCYINFTVREKYVYDTCVLEGQRAWRNDGFNCYKKTN